jgi:hypothetical protein
MEVSERRLKGNFSKKNRISFFEKYLICATKGFIT